MGCFQQTGPVKIKALKAILERYLKKGKTPFDYERSLLVREFDRVMHYLKTRKPVPWVIEVQPTAICNFRCEECIGNSDAKIREAVGGKSIGCIEMASILSDLKEADNRSLYKIKEVKFSGVCGEPLCAPSTRLGIMLAKNYGWATGLFTNGNLLGREDNLRAALNTDYVHTSLYHHFETAIVKRQLENLERLIDSKRVDAKPLVTVGLIVRDGDEWFVHNYYSLLKRIGADKVRVKLDITGENPVPPPKRSLFERSIEDIVSLSYKTDSFDVHAAFPLKGSQRLDPNVEECLIRNFMTTIGADGSVYPCDHRLAPLTRLGFATPNGVLDKVDKEPQERIGIGNCNVCPPYPHRINPFIHFLLEAYRIGKETLLTEFQKLAIKGMPREKIYKKVALDGDRLPQKLRDAVKGKNYLDQFIDVDCLNDRFYDQFMLPAKIFDGADRTLAGSFDEVWNIYLDAGGCISDKLRLRIHEDISMGKYYDGAQLKLIFPRMVKFPMDLRDKVGYKGKSFPVLSVTSDGLIDRFMFEYGEDHQLICRRYSERELRWFSKFNQYMPPEMQKWLQDAINETPDFLRYAGQAPGWDDPPTGPCYRDLFEIDLNE